MRRSQLIALFLLIAVSAFAPAAYASGGLVLVPDPLTVVVLLIGFLILIPLVSRIIVKPILAVFDQRNEKIAGARKRAESLEGTASEILGRYEAAVREVRDESETGRREQIDASRAERAQITARAREEAEGEIARSQREIATALSEARAGLRASAEQLARQAAERILGRAVS